MKKALLIILLLTVYSMAFAQRSDTTWFSKKWEKTERQHGYYYRVVASNAPGQLLRVQDFFSTGEQQMEGTYTSLEPEVKEGSFTWWHKNGVKQRECLYNNNMLVNLTEWDATGKQTAHKEVVNVVTFVNGEPKYEPKYLEEAPRFTAPGGIMGYLKNNIRYPADAIEAGIGGKVMVSFVVTKKGKIKHVEIVQGVHPSIDAEALRVVKAMPAMSPGRLEGKLIDCNLNLPINFNLN